MMALKKQMSTKSILVISLLMLALTIGGGVAYAFTVNSMPDTSLWAGEASIQDASELSVDTTTTPPGYRLICDVAFANVTDIEVDVASTTGTMDGYVEVRVYGGGSYQGGGQSAQATYALGTTTVTVTLGAPIAVGNCDAIHIVVHEVV